VNRKGKGMQEQVKQQHIPVKIYRTDERLMIAAPMAGLEPENIQVEVTNEGRLILHGEQRAMLKEVKELLVDEWSVGVYHRELALPVPVNAACANVTYGNGVLLVALPISDQTSPRTTDTRTGHSYARATQRQRRPPCDLRSNMIARATLLAQATNGPAHAFSHALPVL
jgi:HSP20 family protein